MMEGTQKKRGWPKGKPRGPRKPVATTNKSAAPAEDSSPEASGDDAREVIRCVEGFLDGLGAVIQGRAGGRPWEKYIALRSRPFLGTPGIPAFLQYRILGTDEIEGVSPQLARAVRVKLTLCPTGAFPVREVTGILRVLHESAPWVLDHHGTWGVLPTSWQLLREM